MDVIIEPYVSFDVNVVAYEVYLAFVLVPFSGLSPVLRGDNPFRLS